MDVPGVVLDPAPVARPAFKTLRMERTPGVKVAVLALWRAPFLHPDVAALEHGKSLLEGSGPRDLVDELIVGVEDVGDEWNAA